MNTDRQQTQDNKQQPSTKMNEQDKQVQISHPHTERAEGPFKHSGETSGWTREEKEEKEEQEDGTQQA